VRIFLLLILLLVSSCEDITLKKSVVSGGSSGSSALPSLFVQLGVTTTAGGSNAGNDRCSGVTVDSSGNIYCAGYTNGGMSEANGGSNDAFVMRLEPDGNFNP